MSDINELIKSTLRFSWAMPLFGTEQLTNLLKPQEATEAFNSVTQATEEQLSEPLRAVFNTGAQLQGSAVDLASSLLTPGSSVPRQSAQSSSDATTTAPPAAPAGTTTAPGPPQALDVDLEYLKVVNNAGPTQNPAILLSLMAGYANANREKEGIAFFESLIAKFDAQLPPPLKGLYLGALGQLRASYINRVPPAELFGWVSETIEILENARNLSNNQLFVIRWIIGVVYAQLPDVFQKREQAFEDLNWCLQNLSTAPEPGWIREVYFSLGLLNNKAGDQEQAQKYLNLSGYKSFDKEIVLTTSASVTAENTIYSPIKLEQIEIGSGRIFILPAFQFASAFFILSEDQTELISIGAGVRPETIKAVYDYLKSQVPELPPLTTVFVTHSHPDHIGGHRFFRELNSSVKFYTRDNYHEELERITNRPLPFDWFFGEDYSPELVADFEPNVTVATRTEVSVGGTEFVLHPARGGGGETPDAMFIHLPKHGIIFVGDFIMPWFGGPFYDEGSVTGLLDSMDHIIELQAESSTPLRLLHGHYPLDSMYNSADVLQKVKPHFQWLLQETLKLINQNVDRAAIHHKNLIPPNLIQDPVAQLPYLVTRRNLIDRLYRQHVGYWGSGLQGIFSLNREEVGSIFSHYFELTEEQVASAIERMVNSGDYELASQTLVWTLPRYRNSERLAALEQRTNRRLKEKHQQLDAFRFFVFSEVIEDETPLIKLPSETLET